MLLRGNFMSEILCMSTNIQVLIPEKLEGPYRIVYLLHGQHGDQGTWMDNTMLPYYAKKYNTIIAAPAVNRSFYLNLKYGRRYFDYVSEELPEKCQRIFNISSRREDTAVMGCSMGAYGSLRLVLTKPDRFGFCGAISPACIYFRHMLEALRNDPSAFMNTNPEAEEILVDLKSTYGEELEFRDDYDIVKLVRDFPADAPKPKFYVTCGTEDNLRKENLAFRDEMKNHSFDYTYEEWSGGHEWYFFNDALKKTIEFWYSD